MRLHRDVVAVSTTVPAVPVARRIDGLGGDATRDATDDLVPTPATLLRAHEDDRAPHRRHRNKDAERKPGHWLVGSVQNKSLEVAEGLDLMV